MSDPLAITAEDAEGLARLAEAQLRLALRFAERAETEDDIEAACKLAHASERAARGYRQSLLIKSRLLREREAARRETAVDPRPPDPQGEARRVERQRELYEAVEAIACEAIEDVDELDFTLDLVRGEIDVISRGEGFLDASVAAQAADICAALGIAPAPLAEAGADPAAPPSPPDSS